MFPTNEFIISPRERYRIGPHSIISDVTSLYHSSNMSIFQLTFYILLQCYTNQQNTLVLHHSREALIVLDLFSFQLTREVHHAVNKLQVLNFWQTMAKPSSVKHNVLFFLKNVSRSHLDKIVYSGTWSPIILNC